MFQKAQRKQARIRFALQGPPGSGKTFTALRMATAVLAGVGGAGIAFIDTENRSSELYAELANPDGGAFDFDMVDLTDESVWGREPCSPQNYMRAIKGAADAGYKVLIIDSLSHAWAGKGGLLEQVDKFTAASRTKNNKFAGGWSQATPIQHDLVNTILNFPGHVFVTLRTKMAYETEGGKPRKIGLAPVQRDGVEYEFTIVAECSQEDQGFTVSKSRCDSVLPVGDRHVHAGAELANRLLDWAESGAPEDPKPEPEPEPEPEQEGPGLTVEEFNASITAEGLNLQVVQWFLTTHTHSRKAQGAMSGPERLQAFEYLITDAGRAKLAEKLAEREAASA